MCHYIFRNIQLKINELKIIVLILQQPRPLLVSYYMKTEHVCIGPKWLRLDQWFVKTSVVRSIEDLKPPRIIIELYSDNNDIHNWDNK